MVMKRLILTLMVALLSSNAWSQTQTQLENGELPENILSYVKKIEGSYTGHFFKHQERSNKVALELDIVFQGKKIFMDSNVDFRGEGCGSAIDIAKSLTIQPDNPFSDKSIVMIEFFYPGSRCLKVTDKLSLYLLLDKNKNILETKIVFLEKEIVRENRQYEIYSYSSALQKY